MFNCQSCGGCLSLEMKSADKIRRIVVSDAVLFSRIPSVPSPCSRGQGLAIDNIHIVHDIDGDSPRDRESEMTKVTDLVWFASVID